ncbi:MAG: DUF2306 domain-containing protein [Pseudomonadota bacterium]
MISLEPLASEPPPIPGHALVACSLVALGALQLALPKGTLLHKALGWVFVIGLGFVTISGLFISTLKTFGYFSPIHLIIPYTLASLVYGVWAVRCGNVAAHRTTMIWLYVTALVVAGAFTLLPGRVMHDVFFAG